MENQTLLTLVPKYANKLRKDGLLFTGAPISVSFLKFIVFNEKRLLLFCLHSGSLRDSSRGRSRNFLRGGGVE